MQAVTVTPKFVFGVNGQLNNSLHIHEEKKLVYVAGHNVIVYDLEEGTQQFIPGSANADEINYIAMSPSGRLVALCERAQPRSQVTIFDVPTRQRKKTLPEFEMENLPFECKEFLSCAFSPVDEKHNLVTLCGEGDWCVIMWQWDTFKMLSKFDLNVVSPSETKTFQISMAQIMQDQVIVVTGSKTFSYLKLEENMRSIVQVHGELDTRQASDEYTCHTWAKDSVQLVIGTAEGEILVANMRGEFVICVPTSPFG